MSPVVAPMTPFSSHSRRSRILFAALELFSEKTFGGTAIPSIAERADVAVGTIYRYFPNKESLGEAVFVAGKQALIRAVLTDEVREAPPEQALRHIWHALVAFATDHPALFAFMEFQMHAGYLGAEAAAVLRELHSGLVAVISAAQHAGVVREGDPLMLISMVFGSFVGATKYAATLGLPLTDLDLPTMERAAFALLGVPAGGTSGSPAAQSSESD
ncbi:HTH-type transcriptional repressor FatR [Paractinoplanes toevensis]|uniref:HTH-type transcriptional repressor FatR n=2 Tax=Paractinoplanes toevensis TaxID=571911 RepID=A0A919TCG4_9ACTN|nr:HTH-type transcriptional repressor FatR [Actinoplanes toevensis]